MNLKAVGVAMAALFAAASAQAEIVNGNTGAYMSPFTSDGVTAAWVTKSMSVKASGEIGAAAGSLAAAKLLENVPFGSMFGQAAGKAVGRSIALKSIGGEEFLKSTSDLSFNNYPDMAQHIKDNYSDREDIAAILQATYAIYPDLEAVYYSTGRMVKFDNEVKGNVVPNAQGMMLDLYRVSVAGPQMISVSVAAEQMAPMVVVTPTGKSRPVATAQAAKGATSVTLEANLPAAGEYQVSVQPVPKFMGPGKGGLYTLSIRGAQAQVASTD